MSSLTKRFRIAKYGGLEWVTVSGNTTAQTDHGYMVDVSAGPVTVTLPASPSIGDIVGIADITRSSETNNITIGRNGSNISGLAEDLIVNINGAGFDIVYANATVGWEIVSEVGSRTTLPFTWDASDNITTNGNLTVNGTITETSSIRYKSNIRELQSPLDSVIKLNGVMYDKGTETDQTGFIAEEVEKVLPNVVTKDEDGDVEGVKYTQIIAYLVESIKELEARVKELEKNG